MANNTKTIEDTVEGSSKADVNPPRPRAVSREFVWIVALLVVVAIGALGFKAWQYYQQGPDLRFTQDFIQSDMELSNPPQLARVGLNEQIAAFYKENGPVHSIVSKQLVETGKSYSGDPTYVVKYNVESQKGPVDVMIKVQNHQGERSVISLVYVPQY
jgi:hypothetical protein